MTIQPIPKTVFRHLGKQNTRLNRLEREPDPLKNVVGPPDGGGGGFVGNTTSGTGAFVTTQVAVGTGTWLLQGYGQFTGSATDYVVLDVYIGQAGSSSSIHAYCPIPPHSGAKAQVQYPVLFAVGNATYEVSVSVYDAGGSSLSGTFYDRLAELYAYRLSTDPVA